MSSLERLFHVLTCKWFEHVVGATKPLSRIDIRLLLFGSQQNERYIFEKRTALNLFKQFKTVHFGHTHVRND